MPDHRRRVVERVVLRVHGVVEHRRQRGRPRARAFQQVVPDDDDGEAGGPHVLLRAGVDEPMARDIDRPAEHVRRDVADQRDIAGLRQLLPLRAFDRVVRRHVHVGGAGGERQLRGSGNAGVFVGLRRAGDVDLADFPRLVHGFPGPGTRVDVVGRRSGPTAGSSAPSRTAGWRRPAETGRGSCRGCRQARACRLRPARGSTRRSAIGG